jgi:hypothetical protein
MNEFNCKHRYFIYIQEWFKVNRDFFLKMWAPEKLNSFVESGWPEHPSSAHFAASNKLASDLITSSVEQRCMIRFLVKEKVKLQKFFVRYVNSVGKGPYHMQVSQLSEGKFVGSVF